MQETGQARRPPLSGFTRAAHPGGQEVAEVFIDEDPALGVSAPGDKGWKSNCLKRPAGGRAA
jgi:hypothetical protein